MRPFCIPVVLLLASASGCVVVHDNPPPVVTCDIPTIPRSSGNYPLFHVIGGSSSAIPTGDIGYLVTADGQGLFRVNWTDTLDSAACFTGIVSTTGTFNPSQTRGYSGAETISVVAPNEIRFASVPGSALDGIDVFPTTDPLYLDAYVDGQLGGSIYFPDGTSGLITTTSADPAAFSSP